MKQSPAILGNLPGGKVCLFLSESFSLTGSRVYEVMSWEDVAEREARYKTTEPFWDRGRTPSSHFMILPRQTMGFPRVLPAKPCPILDDHRPWWSLAAFPYFPNPGLYLPKFVLLWASRIFLTLPYRSRLALFRVQYDFQCIVIVRCFKKNFIFPAVQEWKALLLFINALYSDIKPEDKGSTLRALQQGSCMW